MAKNPHHLKAVILDVDQTITLDTGSWLQFTALLGADPQVHVDIFQRFKTGEISYPEAKRELINLWRTANNLSKKNIQEVFDKVQLRKGAYAAVQYLKKKYQICIISGAIDIFVDAIAGKLGIADSFSHTRFIFDSSSRLIDFEYKLSRGEEKVEYFHSFCRKNNLDPRDCAAIGDGDSDMPIFAEVGLPVLFIASETSEELQKKIKVHLRDWKDIRKIL